MQCAKIQTIRSGSLTYSAVASFLCLSLLPVFFDSWTCTLKCTVPRQPDANSEMQCLFHICITCTNLTTTVPVQHLCGGFIRQTPTMACSDKSALLRKRNSLGNGIFRVSVRIHVSRRHMMQLTSLCCGNGANTKGNPPSGHGINSSGSGSWVVSPPPPWISHLQICCQSLSGWPSLPWAFHCNCNCNWPMISAVLDFRFRFCPPHWLAHRPRRYFRIRHRPRDYFSSRCLWYSGGWIRPSQRWNGSSIGSCAPAISRSTRRCCACANSYHFRCASICSVPTSSVFPFSPEIRIICLGFCDNLKIMDQGGSQSWERICAVNSASLQDSNQ